MKQSKYIGIFSALVFTVLLSGCGKSEQSAPPSQLIGGSIQGKSLSLSGVVTTFAGISGSADGIGVAASFNNPNSITSDGTNLYVADFGNNIIRKIAILTGAVTTLAGAAGMPGSADGVGAVASFNGPQGITTDGINLYVTEEYNNTIRKIVISSGVVTTLAGTVGISGSSDGTGTSASFYGPYGIATDGTNLYVADSGNSTIRKIVISTGTVTTLAGTAGVLGSSDGIGAAASFNHTLNITIDGSNLYVTDGNNVIRKIALPSGTVTTFVGTGAGFSAPTGITSDGTNLFVTDNNTIRKVVISTGTVTTLAGTAGVWGSADGNGVAASFRSPSGITVNGTSLFVTDFNNNTIRKIAITSAAVATLAGTPQFSPSAYDGIRTAASFYQPHGITSDGTNLYVADAVNSTIRKIVISTGEVSTLAGVAGAFNVTDGVGAAARFSNPLGITTDGTNLYVTDARSLIRKIEISSGSVTTIAGGSSKVSADGIGSAASFSDPRGITTDRTNLYVADTGNATIRKIVISTGMVTTLAGTAGIWGAIDGTGAAARFDAPEGITTDGTHLYVADLDNTIRKIDIATGAATTMVGTATMIAGSNGLPVGYRGITMDGTNLYVTNDATNTIQQIVIATGAVTTVAGSAGKWGSADGSGSAARFNIPVGITTDGTNLFVVDSANNSIRKMQ